MLLIVALFSSQLLLAHPGHTRKDANSPRRERSWTAEDQPSRNGSFVVVKDGQVQIRQADATLVNRNLSELSDTDPLWVEQRQAARSLF